MDLFSFVNYDAQASQRQEILNRKFKQTLLEKNLSLFNKEIKLLRLNQTLPDGCHCYEWN